MPIPVDQFKYVMRQWASGVTIVTMQAPETRKHGLTVSGFLERFTGAAVGVDLDRGRIDQRGAAAKTARAFVVNFLRDDQGELSDRFAGRLGEVDRFEGVPTQHGGDRCADSARIAWPGWIAAWCNARGGRSHVVHRRGDGRGRE